MVFNYININKKGQLSVEFILIILVILVLIETIILPLRDYSQNSLQDVSSIAYLENAKDKIISTVNIAQAYSEVKLNVKFYIPEDVNFYLLDFQNGDSNILYTYKLKSGDISVKDCDINRCSNQAYIGKVRVASNVAVTDNALGYTFEGPNNYSLTITKASGIITITNN
jgi:uncharacterized protein (UPF0333 family)